MKTGFIVHVMGDEPRNRILNLKAEIKKLKLPADRVEITSHNFGHCDIHYAWWSLTVKGMDNIVCTLAEITPFGGLQLMGRELRLCG